MAYGILCGIVTVLGLVGGAPTQCWGGDTRVATSGFVPVIASTGPTLIRKSTAHVTSRGLPGR